MVNLDGPVNIPLNQQAMDDSIQPSMEVVEKPGESEE